MNTLLKFTVFVGLTLSLWTLPAAVDTELNFDGLVPVEGAVDRRTARHAGGLISWNNRVTNAAEGRRLFGRWADRLVSFLDQHYGVEGGQNSP